ncbi:hypothetical protein HDU80_007952 [Chytriomyces hyalinus]|nr:hypothetical protein HDU80_007952 [Chytriomyces hyalinus]
MASQQAHMSTRRNSQSVENLVDKTDPASEPSRANKHTRSGRVLAEVAYHSTTPSSREGSRTNLQSNAADSEASFDSSIAPSNYKTDAAAATLLSKKKICLVDGLADKLGTQVRVSDPTRSTAVSLSAQELVERLQTAPKGLLILDVRSLQDFTDIRIKGSANISLPSLILKRIQRNVVSSFQLESFLTNDTSKHAYRSWIDASLTSPEPAIVVTDEVVNQKEDPESDTFMVVKAVLGSQLLATRSNIKLFYLNGGLQRLYELPSSHPFFEGERAEGATSSENPVPQHHHNVPAINTKTTANASAAQPFIASKFAETPTTLPSDYETPILANIPGASPSDSLFATPTSSTAFSATSASPFRSNSLLTPTSSLGTPTSATKSKRPSFAIVTTAISAANTIRTGSIHEESSTPVVHASTITEYMMLGSEVVPTADDAVEQLKALGVTHVLNMAREVVDEALEPGEAVTGISFLKIGVYDHPDEEIDGPIRQGISYIEKARRDNPKARVLVHCKAGRSRSAAVVLAYLIASEKMTLKAAYELVNTARKGIIPNIGFMLALKNIEMEVHGFNTEISGTTLDGRSVI